MLVGIGNPFAPEAIEAFVRNCLLVLGGFMAGYLLGWGLGYGFNKWVAKGKAPGELNKLLRVACGLIVAILVALMVFTGGGRGPGPGGPAGSGTGEANTGTDKKGETPADPKAAPKEQQPDPKKPTAGGSELPVTVKLLGGSAVEGEKAYQLGDDPKKLTLKELQDALLAKRTEAGAKGIRVVRERPGPEPISLESPNWRYLERWLETEQIPY